VVRKFAFEGDMHEKLDCVPLAVRRKLDLAGLKISLAGWQTLTRPERLALCNLDVDEPGALAIYTECLEGFASRGGVSLGNLGAADPRAWSPDAIPDRIAAALHDKGRTLAPARWARLDEDERYCLHKLADPKRDPAKFWLLVEELELFE